MLELDHVLWAAPDLDKGTRFFEELTGVAPAPGGTHPGFGTRNRLVALGEGTYFEIITPDPAQDRQDNLGGRLEKLPHPGLLTFALRSDDLEAARATAMSVGLTTEGPISMSRTRPDGVRLEWSILYLRHANLGDAVPFVIDWRNSPHPSGTTPGGCTLRSFVALQPDPEPLRRIYAALGLRVDVKRSLRPGFLAVLETPRGEVVLLSP